MPIDTLSGQAPFAFAHRPDLNTLPPAAAPFEVNLHGGFASDPRPGHGQVYYGMPGYGILRIDADLGRQELISLPAELTPLNFHATAIGQFDGQWRLILPANNDAKVAVVNLDGRVEFVLPRPVFQEYQAAETPYKPTAAVLVEDELFIADGYGSNYITSYDVAARRWRGIFGGKAEHREQPGKFSTAHGIHRNPTHHHLDIADRPNSRVQVHGVDGGFLASHALPAGAWPCGIAYAELGGRWLAVVGCLRDPVEGRPAPIYILDAATYELLSTIRPKEELGIEPAQHLHNVVLHVHGGRLFLVCQSWNPGHYFVLEQA